MSGFEALKGNRYLNLETFRKNGVGVRTPVWFAAAPEDGATLYVYSTSRSGKAKRLRHGGAVRVAPCDVRGKSSGPWIDAQASIVGDEEFRRGMRLIDRKYYPWKQLLDLLARFLSSHARIVIAIRRPITRPPG